MLRLYEYVNSTMLGVILYPTADMRNEYIKKYGIQSYSELGDFTEEWDGLINPIEKKSNDE